jgi:antitoxin (DNA-binding transcriptional repressor) of toxin-antitoxin stability system
VPKTTRAVGVKDLKNNLSAHLQEVRRGARILVTDRHVVVAELREPGADADALPASVLDQWAAGGLVTLPSRPRAPLPRSPIRLPDGASRALLDELRSDEPRSEDR